MDRDCDSFGPCLSIARCLVACSGRPLFELERNVDLLAVARARFGHPLRGMAWPWQAHLAVQLWRHQHGTPWPEPSPAHLNDLVDSGEKRRELLGNLATPAIASAITTCISVSEEATRCAGCSGATVAIGRGVELALATPAPLDTVSTVADATDAHVDDDDALLRAGRLAVADGLSTGKARNIASSAADRLVKAWGEWAVLSETPGIASGVEGARTDDAGAEATVETSAAAATGTGCDTTVSEWSKAEIEAGMRLVEAVGGEDALPCLLGQRQTPGTKWLLPPSPAELMLAANRLHPGTSQKLAALSVAARAAAKHAHRGADCWFGDAAEGKTAARIARAAILVARLLASAVWWNAHEGAFEDLTDAPAGGADGAASGVVAQKRITVFEVRDMRGYGARWAVSSDGSNVRFRGFLEPHVEGGHAVGWRH